MVQQCSQAGTVSEIRRATDPKVGVFFDNLVSDRLGKAGDSLSLALWAPVQPDSGVDLWDEPTYTRLRGRSRVDRPERIRDRGGRP